MIRQAIRHILFAAIVFAPAKLIAQDFSTYKSLLGDKLVDPDFSGVTDSRWISPEIGISKGFGETIGFTIVYDCFTVYGGLGKDWMFNGNNKHKLLWNAGMGLTTSFIDELVPNSSVRLGFTFSENSSYEHHALTLDCRCYKWIGTTRQWGVYGGGGLGIADITCKSTPIKFAWNIEVGFSYQIRFGNKIMYNLYNM